MKALKCDIWATIPGDFSDLYMYQYREERERRILSAKFQKRV
jgi:hypothetical protein